MPNSRKKAPSYLRCAANGNPLAANPKAEICAFKGQTLRIECKLVEDSRPEIQKALIEKMPVLKPALGENGENGVMYYLADATATFFKMMEPVETVKF